MKYSIAIDVGATKTLGALVFKNKIIKKIKKPTFSQKNNEQILKNIKNIVLKLAEDKKIETIGLGLAGQIDYQKGVVVSAPNFNPKFKNIKLKEFLSKEFKCQVIIDNDVKSFALAENNFGLGKIFKNYICLTFGTGIGGALVLNNQLLRGTHNLAGEFGHMKISSSWIGNAPLSGFGQKYCWESVASGRAWQKIAKKYGPHKADQIIINNIAIGLSNLASIINPQAIILGGGLIEHNNIINKIKKEFNKQVFHSSLKNTKILKSKLGENSILLGSLIKE